MTSNIPYTHWAYFPNEASARRCADADLADYVIRIKKAIHDSQWVLLAGRDVAVDDLEKRHDEVKEIVERHGGQYDYGEATYVDGEAVADPLLTGQWPTA